MLAEAGGTQQSHRRGNGQQKASQTPVCSHLSRHQQELEKHICKSNRALLWINQNVRAPRKKPSESRSPRLLVCLFVCLLITASFAITSLRRMKWRHSECGSADGGRQPVPLAGLLVFREQSEPTDPKMVSDVATQQPNTRGMSETISAAPPPPLPDWHNRDQIRVRGKGEFFWSAFKRGPALPPVLVSRPPRPRPRRSESAEQLRWWDSITVSATKGGVFLWSALQTCAAWLSALHIKHPGLSVCAQAAATKSAFPAWSARILASSSAQDEITKQQQTWLLFSGLGEEQAMVEGRLGQIKFPPFAVSTRNRLFGSFAQRCGSLILFISAIKFFLLISVEFEMEICCWFNSIWGFKHVKR